MNVDPINFLTPVISPQGLFNQFWQRWLTNLRELLVNLNVNIAAGVVTSAPTGLGASDTGRQFFVTTSADGLTVYNHLMTWTGAKWSFGGDIPGRFCDEQLTGLDDGWQLCDGTVTKRLTAGATIGETAMTALDETTHPSVHESAAAYTGAITPPVAPGFTGTPVASGNASAGAGGTAGGFVGYANINHTHSVTAQGTIDTTGKQQLVSVIRYVRR